LRLGRRRLFNSIVPQPPPNRYRSVFTNFRFFLGHDDATKVTAEDVIRFKDARLGEGISGKTRKDAVLSPSQRSWPSG
jgi:hypothetical protein